MELSKQSNDMLITMYFDAFEHMHDLNKEHDKCVAYMDAIYAEITRRKKSKNWIV